MRAWFCQRFSIFPIHDATSIDLLVSAAAVSTYALVVDDLDNSGEAAAFELQHTADLDATPRSRSDIDLCHFVDFLEAVGGVSDRTQQCVVEPAIVRDAQMKKKTVGRL